MKLLVLDRGHCSGMVSYLGRFFSKVWYCNIAAPSYMKSPSSHIGKGLPNMEFVESPWPYMDKADLVWFPDTYDGEMQQFLLSKGIPVVGSLGGQKMELDKYFYCQEIVNARLPLAETYRADGLDDLWDHVKNRTPGSCFMKNAEKERGDWETLPHVSRQQTELFLEVKRAELGQRAKDIEILVQDRIDGFEVGIDTPAMIDGEIPLYASLGYEGKEKSFVSCINRNLPHVLQKITGKLAKVYAKLGYRGPYSNEVRVTNQGIGYPIDETCRVPRPPGPLMAMQYGEGYAKALQACSRGELPNLSFEKKHGAELILASSWYAEGHELHIGSVKVCETLGLIPRNAIVKDGEVYCIPCPGEENFADLCAIGDTVDEAIGKVLEAAEQLNIYQMHYDATTFNKARETIALGEKQGIPF